MTHHEVIDRGGPAGREAVAVAVDVGGTTIKCALVTASGAVLHTERHPTLAEHGPAAVVQTIITVVENLTAKAVADGQDPYGAGVVIPGVVDEARGLAVWSANLGLRDVPLRDEIAARVGLAVALGHDVRAGALAEARLGAGRGHDRTLFVAIGTGIAGGYVIGGRVDPGAHGAAGEIGHIVVRTGADAHLCGCGARGCLEAHASAAAIARAYATAGGRAVEGGPSYTGDVREATLQPSGAREVAEAMARGDADALRIWGDATSALAAGLLTAVALYDPELVVLGGGLAEAGDLLLTPVREAMAAGATFHRLPQLACAALGDQAGCLGAALLALDRKPGTTERDITELDAAKLDVAKLDVAGLDAAELDSTGGAR